MALPTDRIEFERMIKDGVAKAQEQGVDEQDLRIFVAAKTREFEAAQTERDAAGDASSITVLDDTAFVTNEKGEIINTFNPSSIISEENRALMEGEFGVDEAEGVVQLGPELPPEGFTLSVNEAGFLQDPTSEDVTQAPSENIDINKAFGIDNLVNVPGGQESLFGPAGATPNRIGTPNFASDLARIQSGQNLEFLRRF